MASHISAISRPESASPCADDDEAGHRFSDTTTKKIPDETTEKQPKDTTKKQPDTNTEDHELLRSERLRIIAMGAIGYVYRCPGNFAYKQHAGQREFDLMMLAGDCSIKPVCRVVRLIQGVSVMDGMVMELATPFVFKAVLFLVCVLVFVVLF